MNMKYLTIMYFRSEKYKRSFLKCIYTNELEKGQFIQSIIMKHTGVLSKNQNTFRNKYISWWLLKIKFQLISAAHEHHICLILI